MNNNQISQNSQTPPQSPIPTNQVERPTYKKLIVIGGVIALFLIVVTFFIRMYLSKNDENKYFKKSSSEILLNTKNPINLKDVPYLEHPIPPQFDEIKDSILTVDRNMYGDLDKNETVIRLSPDNKKIASIKNQYEDTNSSKLYVYEIEKNKLIFFQDRSDSWHSTFSDITWSPNSDYIVVDYSGFPIPIISMIVDIKNTKIIKNNMESWGYSWTKKNSLIYFKHNTKMFDGVTVVSRNDIVELDIESLQEKVIQKSGPLVTFFPVDIEDDNNLLFHSRGYEDFHNFAKNYIRYTETTYNSEKDDATLSKSGTDIYWIMDLNTDEKKQDKYIPIFGDEKSLFDKERKIKFLKNYGIEMNEEGHTNLPIPNFNHPNWVTFHYYNSQNQEDILFIMNKNDPKNTLRKLRDNQISWE